MKPLCKATFPFKVLCLPVQQPLRELMRLRSQDGSEIRCSFLDGGAFATAVYPCSSFLQRLRPQIPRLLK